ncbi:ATP synthase mitochondrial F1 complex assembly factor 1 isoform X2 [Xenopus laevis]|uniref:ATP synthase mitochondrial F1 complex assembly factor 1 isoform X2 n=1 Tax=Xenopus laevis TaxID=8355 RepID=A0A8J1KJA0_XENLA|nr:ATP synthase mitochondrial F1 complex assembly factor 1 isoform X2 [Xenopus laevis]
MLGESDREMAAAVVQMSMGYRGLLAVRNRGIGPLALGVVSSQVRAFSLRKEPELEENPYYDKYQDKIQRLRRTNPSAFDARLEKRKEFKQQPLGYSKQAEFAKTVEEKVGTASSKGFTKNKTLDSILNIDLIKDKDADNIKEIWKQYFSSRDTVYAVIPGESFELIQRRAQTCPSFLYALPRKEGYEFFVGQWSGNELHFTALINIQNVQEAQCLANQVQLFYASDRAETHRLVEMFNHKSDEFKYMAVVSLLEQSGLGKPFLNIQGQNKEDKLE